MHCSAEGWRRLVAICEVLQVEVLEGGLTPGPAWVPVDRLAAGLPELIAGEAARIAERHGTAPRPQVAASRLLHHYLWSVGLLLGGPWYLNGRIPRLDPAGLWIDPPSGLIAVRPGGSDPGGSDPGGEAGLRAAAATHFAPVLDAFQPHLRRGPRALWGMAADDLASGIWYLGRRLGEEERAVCRVSRLLPGDTPPFPGAAFRRLPGGHWTRTRLGCCLYYAIRPAEACLTCPRTADAERVRRLAT